MKRQIKNEKHIQTDYIQNVAAHYNKLYAEHEFLFDHNPLTFLNMSISDIFPKAKPILDVGGGNAVTAISLAQMGYHVDVLDISSVAISNLRQKLQQANLDVQVNTIVGDVRTVSLSEAQLYGGIIISLILHHLTPNDAHAVIQKLQQYTDVAGTHVLVCFLNNGYLYRNYGTKYFFPSKQDVQALYAQWEILQLSIQKNAQLRLAQGETNDKLILVARKKMCP